MFLDTHNEISRSLFCSQTKMISPDDPWLIAKLKHVGVTHVYVLSVVSLLASGTADHLASLPKLTACDNLLGVWLFD